MRNAWMLALAGLTLAASATAAPALASDLKTDISVNASSGYLFRGTELSPNDISVGGRMGLTHSSGVGLTVKTQTGKLGTTSFMYNQVGVSYGLPLAPNLYAKVGVDKYAITGFEGASTANFTEVVGVLNYGGLTGSLAYGVAGDILRKKALYTEVGYTHAFGVGQQYRVGADVGYTSYGREITDLGAKNGISVAQLRAGVRLNPNLDLGATYQLKVSKDIAGRKSENNDKFGLQVTYKF